MSEKEDFHKFLAAAQAQAQGGVPLQQAAMSATTLSAFAGGLLNRLRFGSKPRAAPSSAVGGPGTGAMVAAVHELAATSHHSSGSLEGRPSAFSLGSAGDGDEEDGDGDERGSLSASVGGQLALSAFVGSVQAAEASLTQLQRRHLQAEFVWSYEAARQAKADAMGVDVVSHAQAFARKVGASERVVFHSARVHACLFVFRL